MAYLYYTINLSQLIIAFLLNSPNHRIVQICHLFLQRDNEVKTTISLMNHSLMSLSTPSPFCRVDKIILSAIINTFRIENMATVYGTLGPCFFFSFFWVASVLAQQTSYLIIGSNVDYRIFCRHKRSCRRDQNFFAAKITCPFFRI